jgi:ribosomal protein S27E
MLVPNPRRELKCYRCGHVVDSACGGYWFLLLAPRGRVHFPAAPSRKLNLPEPTTAEAVLCAFCGRQLREALEEGGFAPGEAYERVAAKVSIGVSGSGRSEPRRASGHSGLVAADWVGATPGLAEGRSPVPSGPVRVVEPGDG